MKVDITHRLTGAVIFTAEIEATEETPLSIRLGLAVKKAAETRADLWDTDLRDADLRDADLRDADLTRADLRRADLTGADLRDADLTDADLRRADLTRADLTRADLTDADLMDADLRDADLRAIKADMWMTLTHNRSEVLGLIAAIRDGRIDGSQYSGICACLIGTIANIRRCDFDTIPHNPDHPAERWFLVIRPGDKPGDEGAGPVAAKLALEWALEYCALTGIALPPELNGAVREAAQ